MSYSFGVRNEDVRRGIVILPSGSCPLSVEIPAGCPPERTAKHGAEGAWAVITQTLRDGGDQRAGSEARQRFDQAQTLAPSLETQPSLGLKMPGDAAAAGPEPGDTILRADPDRPDRLDLSSGRHRAAGGWRRPARPRHRRQRRLGQYGDFRRRAGDRAVDAIARLARRLRRSAAGGGSCSALPSCGW